MARRRHNPALDQRLPVRCWKPGCAFPIVFAHRRNEDDSASHAVMAIDYLPTENGAWVLTYRSGWNWLLFEPYDETKHAGRQRYSGHFTTCPKSPLWQKRKKPKTRRKEKWQPKRQ